MSNVHQFQILKPKITTPVVKNFNPCFDCANWTFKKMSDHVIPVKMGECNQPIPKSYVTLGHSDRNLVEANKDYDCPCFWRQAPDKTHA
jgi:hypothetical protein